jgi:hypothetical protein
MPSTGDVIKGVENVPTVVEGHVSDLGSVPSVEKLFVHQGVMVCPGALKLLKNCARRNPDLSTYGVKLVIRRHRRCEP